MCAIPKLSTLLHYVGAARLSSVASDTNRPPTVAEPAVRLVGS